MNLQTNLLAAISYIFSLVGAFFLCRAYINVTAKEISLQTKTFIVSNDYLLKTLAQQNSDSVIGFSFTFIGIAVGLISLLFVVILDIQILAYILLSTILASTIIATKTSSAMSQRKYEFAKLYSYSFFVDEYIPDYDQNNFKIDRVVEAIKDFNLQKFDSKDEDNYARVIHLLKKCNFDHTINKIENFKKRKAK